MHKLENIEHVKNYGSITDTNTILDVNKKNNYVIHRSYIITSVTFALFSILVLGEIFINRQKTFNNKPLHFTEKLDGSSATYYYRDGVFGVCSRNLELLESEGNTFWKVAKELRIAEKLGSLEKNYSIQGELIGEGIQGNPYKIKGQTLRIFNVFNIDTQDYLSLDDMVHFLHKINTDNKPLELVPVINYDYKLPPTIEEIIMYADGKSRLNENTDREGVVIRNRDKSISFKAISNDFLLKQK